MTQKTNYFSHALFLASFMISTATLIQGGCGHSTGRAPSDYAPAPANGKVAPETDDRHPRSSTATAGDIDLGVHTETDSTADTVCGAGAGSSTPTTRRVQIDTQKFNNPTLALLSARNNKLYDFLKALEKTPLKKTHLTQLCANERDKARRELDKKPEDNIWKFHAETMDAFIQKINDRHAVEPVDPRLRETNLRLQVKLLSKQYLTKLSTKEADDMKLYQYLSLAKANRERSRAGSM